MAFDFNILDVEINIPSDDIRDYTLFIASNPGMGKTTLVKQIPGSFTIDLDRGTKSHAMMAQQANTWEEIKEIVAQLVQTKRMNEKALKAKANGEKEVDIKVGKKKLTLPVDKAIEVTGKIKFVSIDTINQAKQYAKQYLIDQRNQKYILDNKPEKVIDTFNELGWGKDDDLERELMSVINDLRDNGYGVGEVSHVRDKKYNRDTENEYTKVIPDLQDNERNYLVGAADIEIQIEREDVVIKKAERNKEGKIIKPAVTEQKAWMYLRANSERDAKGRFAYLPERIEYGYQNLVDAVKIAVQKEIEYGKSVYGMSDDTVSELKTKQENKKQEAKDQELAEFEQKENAEQAKEQLDNLIEEVIALAKKKTKEDKIDWQIVNALIENPTKYETLEEAKNKLEQLKNLK